MRTNLWKQAPATMTILFITTTVFVLMFFHYGLAYSSAEAVFRFGAVYGRLLSLDMLGEGWRLLAATFVHVGLEHFLVNMVALYFLGRQAEVVFGWGKFLLIYLLSAFMGSVFVSHFSPDVLGAGASTALCGLTAVLVVLRFVVSHPYIEYIGKSLVPFLVMNLLLGFLPGVSLAGHLGGFVGGSLCALIFPIKGLPSKLQPWQRFVALMVYIGVLILCLW